MKKLISLLCLMALLLALAACGGGTSDAPAADAAPADEAAEAAAEPAAEGGGNEFVFEAENVDLTYISGHGWSNEVMGVGLLIKDTYNAGASGGYALGYLYENGNEIEFYVNASEDIDNVTLVLRCTMESKDSSASIDYSMMEVTVNDGEPLQYRTLSFSGIPGLLTVKNELLPFANKTLGTISLKQGENVIRFKITNDIPMEGTMQATAPIMDCIVLKTDSDATIEWASGYPMNTDYIAAN